VSLIETAKDIAKLARERAAELTRLADELMRS
jgi:hypothetical protein